VKSRTAELELFLVGQLTTNEREMYEATDDVWRPMDGDGYSDSEDMIEFAGRACYESWPRPNEATAHNADYIRNIKRQRHNSVLEFGEAVIYFKGVSRTFSHEMVRHRHFSYAQLSQRYVPIKLQKYVVPLAIRGNDAMEGKLRQAWIDAVVDYEYTEQQLMQQGKKPKQARETARAFLPNCAETRITVKGNLRAWRHFIALRATDHAEAEICHVAVETLYLLQRTFPSVFEDFEIKTGTLNPRIATTPLAELV
jgi:thymidylate synthase (FAD)